MKRFPKTFFLLPFILILLALLYLPYYKHVKSSSDVKTLRILTPSWICEKFKLDESASQFTNKNPKVKVVIDKYTNYDTAYYPLINKSNQNKYDIILGGSREFIVPFAESGIIMDFETDFFDDDLRKVDFFPSFLELGNIDGKQYMIPLMGEVVSLVVRKDLLQTAGLTDNKGQPIPPKDWDELYSYAKKLTTQNSSGQKIYGINIDFGSNMLLYSFYASLQAKKGNIYGDNYTNIDVSSSDVKYLLETWQRLVKEGLAPTYTFKDVDAGRSNFKEGNVAMLLAPHSRWAEISSILGEKNVGIMPLPGADKNGSLTFIHGITIPSSSKNKELAINFIKEVLLSRDFQSSSMKTYGKIPSLIRNYEENLSPEWDLILSGVRNASTLPINKDWSKIDKVLQIEIQNCVIGKQSADQTINKMKNELNSMGRSSGF